MAWGRKNALAFYGLAFFLFLVDRALKALAVSGLNARLGGLLAFDWFKNKGAAFSIPVWYDGYTVVSAVLVVAVAALFYWTAKKSDAAALPIAFLLLGGISNLIDRLATASTVDYLIFFNTSAVNLADGMIIAGAAWIILMQRRTKPFLPQS